MEKVAKTARVLFYVSLFCFGGRCGLFYDGPDAPPFTFPGLPEFSIWATAWIVLAQVGITGAVEIAQTIFGGISWGLAIIVSGLWLDKYEMNNVVKWLLFAGFWIGMIIIQIRHVQRERKTHDPSHHALDFAQHSRR